MKSDKKIDEKLELLKNKLKSLDKVVIAFSGGVDSTFLAKVSYDVLGSNALAVTATSSTYSKREFKDAKKLAKLIGIRHIVIESEETEIEGYKENPVNRCYYCKSELFSKLNEIAKKENAVVLDGSNFDDLNDYRPGMKAVEELNVRSPLKEAGLTKQEIRELSKQMDLPTHDKPAIACLASRFPYGTEITRERLAKIEKAEDFLKELGLKQLRVRFHNDIARIEVEKKEIGVLVDNRDKIVAKLKGLGFKYITVDLEGYRTGSMNEGLRLG